MYNPAACNLFETEPVTGSEKHTQQLVADIRFKYIRLQTIERLQQKKRPQCAPEAPRWLFHNTSINPNNNDI